MNNFIVHQKVKIKSSVFVHEIGQVATIVGFDSWNLTIEALENHCHTRVLFANGDMSFHPWKNLERIENEEE